MNTKLLLTASLIAVFTVGLYAGDASAAIDDTYKGNVGSEGQTGSYTLEEALALQAARVAAVEENPTLGSGTPYLDPNGAFGAAIIAGAVFGGVAGAFFIRGRSGKYAAMGRG